MPIVIFKIIINFKFIRIDSLDFEDDGEDESDGGWQQELQRRYAQEANFMAELQARHPTSPPEGNQAINQNFVNQGYHQGQNYAGQNQISNSGQNYGIQQNYVSHNYSGNQTPQNQGPFGPQVGSPF